MKKIGVLLIIFLIIFTTVLPSAYAEELGAAINEPSDINPEEVESNSELDLQEADNFLTNDENELDNGESIEVINEIVVEDISNTFVTDVNTEIGETDRSIDGQSNNSLQGNEQSEVEQFTLFSLEESIPTENQVASIFSTSIGISSENQNINTTNIITTKTSKLGQLKTTNARIYYDLKKSNYFQAGTTYTNQVFYIKLETTHNNKKYYLISNLPSSEKGIIGWVQSSDLMTYDHKHIDKEQKKFYFKGTGVAYNRAWGGSKNLVLNLSDMEFLQYKEFKVNMTEKVGDNTWYRGTYEGSYGNIWIHSNHLTPTMKESVTSRKGQITNPEVEIYGQLDDVTSKFKAGNSHIDYSYYIKKQLEVDGKLYYLLSAEPSSTSGTIGWVNSHDVTTYTHTTVDKIEKTFYFKGKGISYNRAWGGSNNIVLNAEEMKQLQYKEFKVNLTEKVGDNTWYRGTYEGSDGNIWIHSNHLIDQKKESVISRKGQITNPDVEIYGQLDDVTSKFKAGNSHTNYSYYIKKQIEIDGELYYLLSAEPSSTSGAIGWVNSHDVTTYTHTTVDKIEKTFYFKGKGVSYNRAWGGSNNIVLNAEEMKQLQYKEFKVNLTEKVGDNTWYRGTYEDSDGNIWIHSNHLTTKEETNISRVGQIWDTGVEIYQQLDDISSIINANPTHINRVFFIKKQTIIDGKTFYLLSNKPSSEDGVVGWVNKNNITSYSHTGVDQNNKTMYLKGTGYAYKEIWGGSENIVFPPTELEKRKGYGLQVNLTEKVDGNIWYRGILDGKEIWIHSSHVSTQTGKETSKLGKINSTSASIYKNLGDSTSIITAGENHTGIVYYIKRETVLHGKTYYLISNQPSSTSGLIGWIEKDSLDTHDHVGIDSKSKTFYLKGTGVAYNRPWGGTKNVVFNSNQMEARKGAVFQVQLTQKVGNNTWYRGILEGKTVWIHSSHLNSNNYTTYNLTLEQALTMQMKVNPQTDKYRNNPGYVSAEYIDLYGLITGTTVNLRTSPTLSSSVKFSVAQNTKFEILDDNVKGDTVSNSTRWYKIKYNGSTVYVHSSLAKIYGTTNANVNVRETASSSTSSHIYGLASKGTTLTILDMGTTWHKVSYNTWRNAKRDDVRYYLDPNNFVDDPIQRFQFFDISKPSGISASALNSLLSGKGILSNRGQYFVQAEKDYGVNAVYLVAHALLETGHGTSELANGVVYNGVKVHNMYGINAFDSNPRGAGAEKAYNAGWTTPEKAILGGAKWIADNYIYVGQNTIYNMRWNPVSMDTRGGASHQYATDIGWASKQVNTMYQIYKQINNVVYQFDIPKYK